MSGERARDRGEGVCAKRQAYLCYVPIGRQETVAIHEGLAASRHYERFPARIGRRGEGPSSTEVDLWFPSQPADMQMCRCAAPTAHRPAGHRHYLWAAQSALLAQAWWPTMSHLPKGPWSMAITGHSQDIPVPDGWSTRASPVDNISVCWGSGEGLIAGLASSWDSWSSSSSSSSELMLMLVRMSGQKDQNGNWRSLWSVSEGGSATRHRDHGSAIIKSPCLPPPPPHPPLFLG